MVTLLEKKGTLRTLQSAILRSYSENKNLDFTDLENLAFDLRVSIQQEETELETERDRFYNEVDKTVESDYHTFRQSQM
jgi:hypothetical protein